MWSAQNVSKGQPMSDFHNELLAQALGVDEAFEYTARIFCRRTNPVEFNGEDIQRSAFGGCALGDMLLPEANGDQLILGRLIIIPFQVYTAKRRTKRNPFGDSPAAGQRMDQILSGGGGMDHERWPRRIR